MEEQNLEIQVEQQQASEQALTNDDSKLDTRDIVAREFDKLEAKEKEEKPTDDGVVKARERDESGKFKKKEEEPAPEAKIEESAQEKPQESKPVSNPYASWKKEAQAELQKLPENVQKMIQERESQFHKGLQQYKEEAVYGRGMRQAVQPYESYLSEIGANPTEAVNALLKTEMTLRRGSPEQKTQAFMQLAHDYGIDVNALAQTPFNPVEYQLRQELAAIKQQVSGLGQSRQMAEEANLSQTIEQFAQEREHFEDLRETMADLLDRGLAKDLDDAYNKALRLNDDVFAKWQAAQQAQAEKARLEQANNAAKAAKAAAVSVKGSPTGITRAAEPKTTEEAVRQAMAQLGL